MLLHLTYLLLQKKLQSVLNFAQNVSWKSTGNHTCRSVRHPVVLVISCTYYCQCYQCTIMSVYDLQKNVHRWYKAHNNLLNIGVAPNVKFALNSFPWTRFFFCDISLTWSVPDLSLTAVKFPDISRFSRQMVAMRKHHIGEICKWVYPQVMYWRDMSVIRPEFTSVGTNKSTGWEQTCTLLSALAHSISWRLADDYRNGCQCHLLETCGSGMTSINMSVTLCVEDEDKEPLSKKTKCAEDKMTLQQQLHVTDSNVVSTDKPSSLKQLLLKPSWWTVCSVCDSFVSVVLTISMVLTMSHVSFAQKATVLAVMKSASIARHRFRISHVNHYELLLTVSPYSSYTWLSQPVPHTGSTRHAVATCHYNVWSNLNSYLKFTRKLWNFVKTASTITKGITFLLHPIHKLCYE